MKKSVFKQKGQDGYKFFRIPGLVCTASGKLLAYYECRRDISDWAIIDIAVKTSVDEGESWSEDKILVHGNGKTVNNPVMFVDKSELLFMWQEEYHRTFYRKSYDEGDTWGEVIEITESLRTPDYNWTVIACGPGHGTVLSNGRYIIPVWMCSNFEDLKAHHPSVISTIYSDDKGKTWKVGEIIGRDLFVNPSETALVELADGQVMVNIRHESAVKRRGIAYSSDGGEHWGKPYFEDALPDPVCMGSMVAYGDLVYFTNCNSEKDRINLTLYVTKNKGRSWEKLKQISEIGGYSDVTVSPDGKQIYIIYDQFSSKVSDLMFTAYRAES